MTFFEINSFCGSFFWVVSPLNGSVMYRFLRRGGQMIDWSVPVPMQPRRRRTPMRLPGRPTTPSTMDSREASPRSSPSPNPSPRRGGGPRPGHAQPGPPAAGSPGRGTRRWVLPSRLRVGPVLAFSGALFLSAEARYCGVPTVPSKLPERPRRHFRSRLPSVLFRATYLDVRR